MSQASHASRSQPEGPLPRPGANKAPIPTLSGVTVYFTGMTTSREKGVLLLVKVFWDSDKQLNLLVSSFFDQVPLENSTRGNKSESHSVQQKVCAGQWDPATS